MDNLERLFRHLVRSIRATHPQYLTKPFEIAELYQTIVPYRHHRRELGFESNHDYEMALLELLAGARDYLKVDVRIRERLARELASPTPDPGAFREFATAPVALNAEAVRALDAAPDTPAAQGAAEPRTNPEARTTTEPRQTRSAAPAPEPRAPNAAASAAVATPPGPANAMPAGTPARSSLAVEASPGDNCRYCGGDLPQGRRIVFCPHCGQNLTVVNCPACGTELELGWKFCTTCGRPSPT